MKIARPLTEFGSLAVGDFFYLPVDALPGFFTRRDHIAPVMLQGGEITRIDKRIWVKCGKTDSQRSHAMMIDSGLLVIIPEPVLVAPLAVGSAEVVPL